MPTKVIVTTDLGQDEAAALMMMLAAPESFEILGLVATALTSEMGIRTATTTSSASYMPGYPRI